MEDAGHVSHLSAADPHANNDLANFINSALKLKSPSETERSPLQARTPSARDKWNYRASGIQTQSPEPDGDIKYSVDITGLPLPKLSSKYVA